MRAVIVAGNLGGRVGTSFPASAQPERDRTCRRGARRTSGRRLRMGLPPPPLARPLGLLAPWALLSDLVATVRRSGRLHYPIEDPSSAREI